MEQAVSLLRDTEAFYTQFTEGVSSALGISSLSQIRGTAYEQQVWVLYICFALIAVSRAATEVSRGNTVVEQVVSLLNEYSDGHLEVSDIDEDKGDPEGEAFLKMVQQAAASVPAEDTVPNIWQSELWTCSFILDWGLRIVRSQGMQMRVEEGDVRYVVYLHVEGDRDSNS